MSGHAREVVAAAAMASGAGAPPMRYDDAMPPRLELFTRFPEPGRVKAWLISAAGLEGALRVRCRLTCRRLAAAGIEPVRLATFADCDGPEGLARFPHLFA